MRGIILAAGRGSRLKSLTEDRPKCLTALAGKALIDWQREALASAGVDPIAVCTGYKRELLEASAAVTFHNPRWSETNMVGTLACADEWLSKFPCVVSYSDIVYNGKIVDRLKSSTADIAITYDKMWHSLWAARFSDPLADAETFRIDASGRLISIGKKTSSYSDIQGQYMGLLKFSPRGWKGVTEALASLDERRRDKLDMTSLLSLLIDQGLPIQGVPVEGGWCEVDQESDLLLYESRIRANETWPHDWR